MAKQKWYVALVDWTNKKIIAQESDFKTKEDAIFRVNFGMEPEAAQYQLGMGGRAVTDVQAYGPAEEPFAFPEESTK
jgi:hypothetical protein